MNLVYQSARTESGPREDCLQACIATVLGLSLGDVPDFNPGAVNGKLLPRSEDEVMVKWFRKRGLSYIEVGYALDLAVVQELLALDLGGAPYLLTASTAEGFVHTVVCRHGDIVHDPGTEPGHHTITGPCPDGYYRVGLFLFNPND